MKTQLGPMHCYTNWDTCTLRCIREDFQSNIGTVMCNAKSQSDASIYIYFQKSLRSGKGGEYREYPRAASPISHDDTIMEGILAMIIRGTPKKVKLMPP